MRLNDPAVVSNYLFAIAAASLVASLVMTGSPDWIFLLFLLLGFLVRRGPAGQRIAQYVLGLCFVVAVVAQIGVLVSAGEPARAGILGRVYTGENPWLVVVFLAAVAAVAFLVPWLALASSRRATKAM